MVERKSPYVLLLVAFLLCVSSNRAIATDVGGPILADTTWTAANSPYVVTVAVIVGNNATLNIEPGVTVKFNSGLGITVGSQAWGPGTLKAIGNESEKITFTSNATPGAPGQWKDIFFTDFASDAALDEERNYLTGSVLMHCLIRFAGSGSSGTGAVTISQSSPLLDSCEILDSSRDGIRINNGSGVPELLIRGAEITSCPAAVHALMASASVVVEDCNLHHNSGTAIVVDGNSSGGTFVIRNNIIAQNVRGLHHSSNSGQTFTISGNVFANNDSGVGSGGAIYMQVRQSTVVSVSNNVFVGNVARDGGAFYLRRYNFGFGGGGGNVAVVLDSNMFSGNTATLLAGSGDSFGGALYLWNSVANNGYSVVLSNNVIVNNQAVGGPGGGSGFGGGIYLLGGSSAGTYDTVVSLAGDPVRSSVNVFDGNSADVGKAVCNQMPFAKNGANDVGAQYVCWGGGDPHPLVDENLIFDFFDDPTKSFILYAPHIDDPNCTFGVDCNLGEVVDCNGNCAPASWIGDGICDDGAYAYNGVPIHFDCPQFNNDGGDCVTPPPPQPQPAAHNPPSQPMYSDPPSTEPTETNLVVIFHGRKTDNETFTEFWVPMAQEMDAQLGPEWHVFAHNWTGQSNYSVDLILQYAAAEGRAIGKAIAAQDYDHVHLIGHSAGSAAVATAALWIKHPDGDPLSLPSSTTVHTTFLDAYMGVLQDGAISELYGSFSDWSDHYFSREPGLGSVLNCYGVFGLGCSTYSYTQEPIPQCHNADVSWLDQTYTSECKSTHTWPRCFYRYSVGQWSTSGVCEECGDDAQCCNVPMQSYLPYGFGLSKEALGNNWQKTVAAYSRGETVYLGTFPFGEVVEPAPKFVVRNYAPFNVAALPHSTSGDNTADVTPIGLTFATLNETTAGSAWFTAEFVPSEETNFIRFDVDFLSEAGAEGLLTVYVDGNEVAYFDERYMETGVSVQSVQSELELAAGTTHTFSFRLDQFGSISSSVSIESVSAGWAGFETVCPADFVTNATFQPPGDGQVDGADLAYLLGDWGVNPGSLADIVTNATFQPPPDGVVDGADLAFLLGAWGACN